MGDLINAKYLVTFTSTGDSAKRLARFRSRIPMLAFTSSPATRSQLALVWGIETYLGPSVEHTDQMAEQVEQSLLAEGRCVEGDLIVMVAGSPPGIPGSTNTLRVLRVGAGDTGHANPDSARAAAMPSTPIRFVRSSRAGSPGLVTPRLGGWLGAVRVVRVCFSGTLPGWWNGRHGALKMLCSQGRGGSTPPPGTAQHLVCRRATCARVDRIAP